jgi:PAS domain S-box-containing protein
VRADEPIRPPEFSELEAFVLAVDEGSIARAATRLRISAPAAAKRIRQLEAISRRSLLDRDTRGVRATAAGSQLYAAARDILDQRGRLVEALAGHPPTDPLRISGLQRLLGRLDAPPAKDVVRQTEALLAALFHAAREPIVMTRADDSMMCEINEAGVRLIGYEQREIRGQLVAELNLWDEIERRNELVRRTLATGEPQQGELTIITKQGERQPVRARFQPVELRGIRYLLVMLELLTS